MTRCVKCEGRVEDCSIPLGLVKVDSSDDLCQRCELAIDLEISLEDTDKVISRFKDLDDPSKWLTIDEFLEKVKYMVVDETLETGDRDVEVEPECQKCDTMLPGFECKHCGRIA